MYSLGKIISSLISIFIVVVLVYFYWEDLPVLFLSYKLEGGVLRSSYSYNIFVYICHAHREKYMHLLAS